MSINTWVTALFEFGGILFDEIGFIDNFKYFITAAWKTRSVIIDDVLLINEVLIDVVSGLS